MIRLFADDALAETKERSVRGTERYAGMVPF